MSASVVKGVDEKGQEQDQEFYQELCKVLDKSISEK